MILDVENGLSGAQFTSGDRLMKGGACNREVGLSPVGFCGQDVCTASAAERRGRPEVGAKEDVSARCPDALASW